MTQPTSSQPARPATSPSASPGLEEPTPNPDPVPAGKQTPSVGRIVHYRLGYRGSGPCLAALITQVRADQGVTLLVCPPYDTPVHVDAREGGQDGWHWPERVGS